MMQVRAALSRLLDSPAAVPVSCAITLAIGYFFVFVWAPHPWGWQGIDQYHDLARALAAGEPFPTTDVPWGYAYYGAFFYRLFGERVWIPVAVQTTINALVPFLLYRLVEPLTDRRVASLAAAITAVFSFNTIYASTQSSDALCTVLFMSSLLVSASGIRTGRWLAFALAGFLSGLVPQFRPNMILLPPLMAAAYVVIGRTRAHVMRSVVYGLMMTAALTPWIVRNYRLTQEILPTSTHGGIQLWYGSLQTGPYLESRAHNPRSIYESEALPYWSLPNRSLIVTVNDSLCGMANPPELVYWTDRAPQPQRLRSIEGGTLQHRYDIPGQPLQTTVYYYLDALRDTVNGPRQLTAPPNGAVNPYVAIVDDRHLVDMDRHNDFLDVFDIARLVRKLAWQDGVSDAPMDLNKDGVISRADLSQAIKTLLQDETAVDLVAAVTVTSDDATLNLADGSTLSVPKNWSGKQSDLSVSGALASALVSRWIRRTSIGVREEAIDGCGMPSDIRFNNVFYRSELHRMNRYMALAFDNIGRDPVAFAAASAYRMVRLFIIRGTSDPHTTKQFTASGIIYAVGTVLSATYFAVFVAGAWIAWRRRSAVLYLLAPIVYVPLTICFVLTNMRYTVTMQPLMFVFVSIAVLSALRLDSPMISERSGGRNEGPA